MIPNKLLIWGKYMFEMMSGLKIHYMKSEIITIGGDNNTLAFYADMFNCPPRKLHMKI
jgi:hypothetical protein